LFDDLMIWWFDDLLRWLFDHGNDNSNIWIEFKETKVKLKLKRVKRRFETVFSENNCRRRA
jgi:hypothetical protein